MGITIAKALQGMMGKAEMRILMVGLDAAGKVLLPSVSSTACTAAAAYPLWTACGACPQTTILYKLKLGEIVTTVSKTIRHQMLPNLLLTRIHFIIADPNNWLQRLPLNHFAARQHSAEC